MAIDPSKMAAFASTGPKPGSAEGGAPAPAPEVEAKDEDMLEGGEGQYGALIPMLEANAEELDACCDEVAPEALLNTEADLSDDDHDIFVESFASLPHELTEEMISSLGGLTMEQAEDLATHLESEGMIEDSHRFACYLMHVSKMIDSGDIGMDEGDEDEGGEEEESEEGEDEGGEEEEDEDYGDEEG